MVGVLKTHNRNTFDGLPVRYSGKFKKQTGKRLGLFSMTWLVFGNFTVKRGCL